MSSLFGRCRAWSGGGARTATECESELGQPSTDGINLGVLKGTSLFLFWSSLPERASTAPPPPPPPPLQHRSPSTIKLRTNGPVLAKHLAVACEALKGDDDDDDEDDGAGDYIERIM